MWVLAAGPAFLTMLCFVLEIGNLWLARGELETALEAAALAAVKEWKETNSTALARDHAVVYAAANTVAGSPVILDRNDGGGGANDNLACDGDIVLGEITGEGCEGYIFDADSTPGGACGAIVSLTIDVLTRVDTKNDVSNDIRSWSISGFASSDPNLIIQSVTFLVATVPPQDLEPPYFDLRSPPNGVCSNATPVGNDKNFGIGTIVTQTGLSGYTFSPDCPDDTTSQSFQITFTGLGANAFQPGDSFQWGVDTDGVGPDPLPGDNEYADRGGDFGGTTVTVNFGLSGSGPLASLTGIMLQDPADPVHHSYLIFNNVELQCGNYGVRTRRVFEVTPICQSLFGVPIGPFAVSAQVEAMCEAPGGFPKLVRISQFLCN